MIRKFVCLLSVTTLFATTSCKDSDAISKIDDNAVEVAPASTESVIASDPNIAPPEVSPTETADASGAIMTFDKSEHDFGSISEGENVTYDFAFKNTGKSDLIITDAKGSCGCTVPEYPKDPIKPGASGKIKVSFNSSGRPGQQQKTVTITTNTSKGTEQLNIKASVKPKASA
ncbi:MAG: DUF1573 domain-containing protein [Flavobacterium sp.]|nr:DUF1573 domain-containing protein [Flavobacterium sp.]